MKDGYIALRRKFFDHPFWEERREYSKAEAWIDLIAQARWKDSETSMLHNGQMVKWGRGQLVASVRFLRNRWGWKSNTKVTSFLVLLEKEDMVRYEKKTAIGRITICKYNTYQLSEDANKDSNKTRIRQAEDKTGIKGNKGNKDNIPPIVPQHPKIEKMKSAGYEELFKMEKPLTGEQLEKLTSEFNPQSVRDVFDAMENFKGLTKKYKSTYLTARQWLNRRAEDNGSSNHKPQTKIHDAGTY